MAPPVNVQREIECPHCGVHRVTKAQPNVMLRCAGCKGRYLAPPAGSVAGIAAGEPPPPPADAPEAPEMAPPAVPEVAPTGGGVKVVHGGRPTIKPAPPPAAGTDVSAPPPPAPPAPEAPAPADDPPPPPPAAPGPKVPAPAPRPAGWRRRVGKSKQQDVGGDHG